MSEIVENADAASSSADPASVTAVAERPAAHAKTATLLRVQHLTVAFGQGPARREVVRDLSFDLGAGKTLGLVGESGSGKSMSCHAIMGLLPPAAQVSGSVLFRGAELLGRSDRHMRSIRGDRIGMVFQDPLSSLNPFYTVGAQIEEAYRAHRGASRKAARRVAIEALDRVHIPDPGHRVDQFPHEFSGGMRQRIMIAMALCLEPDLVIADEPTTALDVTVQAQILALLKELQHSTGSALLFVSHDLAVVSEVADHVVVMKTGDPVERGEVERIFSAPHHEYTRQLLAAIPQIAEVAEADPQAAGSDAPTGAAPAVSRPGAATRGERDGLGRGDVLVSVRHLTKVFRARHSLGRRGAPVRAVDDVSFDVASHETFAIVGESGCGKSTTASMIAHLLRPTSGTVNFDGWDVTSSRGGVEMQHLRKDLQIVFQDPFSSLNPRHTVERIVSAPARYQGIEEGSSRADVVAMLERVGLSDRFLSRYPWQLSGGEAQRVGIARALILHPKLVICDEATSALDVSMQARILELLRELQGEMGLSYIFIAHNLAVVDQIADRVAVMKAGRIVEIGEREQVFHRPRASYTRELLAAVPRIPAEWSERRRRASLPAASERAAR